jgi:hypothetical protein
MIFSDSSSAVRVDDDDDDDDDDGRVDGGVNPRDV